MGFYYDSFPWFVRSAILPFTRKHLHQRRHGFSLPILNCFAGLPKLKRIDLNCTKLQDHDVSFLKTVPQLEQFHFDAGMFTTEEIAYICARYPHISGRCLGAYTTHFTLNDVRICGHRKPGLDLPKQQKLFDRYIAEFERLVARYKHTDT